MDEDTFLELLSKLKQQLQGERRAPHKPLLLLWALARVRTNERLTPYKEVEPILRDLLRRFGHPRRQQRPEQPFWRLRKDGLWQIPEEGNVTEDKSGNPKVRLLKETSGGLPEELYERLRGDPDLVWKAAQWLLDEQWPETRHEAIRDYLGLGRPSEVKEKRVRNANFRPEVLSAYEDRCAICEFGARIADQPIGVEAAHIKWHGRGGPDEVPNGLALCSFHHRVLDMGAIGLEQQGSDVVVLISDQVRGESDAYKQQLMDFRGKPLRRPQRREWAPKLDYLAWHRQEVFLGAPREA